MPENLGAVALQYRRLGWSVFPVDWRPSRPKQPLVKWTNLQREKASEDDIAKWWKKWPSANIGVVTGAASGILVVDIETMNAQQAFIAEFGELHNTVRQKTGKPDGIHLLFKHPMNGTAYGNTTKIRPDIDTRGDGGYIVVAPSMHPSGKRYEWVIDPVEMGLDDLLPLPEELKKLFSTAGKEKEPSTQESRKNPDGWVQEALMGVRRGTRTDTCTKLAGYYLRIFHGDVAQTKAILETWNQRNMEPDGMTQAPMDWKEIEQIVHNIHDRQGVEELGDAVGESIAKVQILKYPDGSRKYNVFLKSLEGYAQMTLRELGVFEAFKWKFGELSGHIPVRIKQQDWEIKVNKALEDADMVEIPEDETKIGLIANTVNSEVFSDGVTCDSKYLGSRICVLGDGPDKFIALKLKTLMDMTRFEGEKLTRKEVGEILRQLGFKNEPPIRMAGQLFRCWHFPMDEWRSRYREK